MAISIARDHIEAAPEDVGLSSARLGIVTEVVQRYIDERKFMGAISAVARHGKVVHFETYGSMDDEAGKPMTADALFRLYSMTKPIVSVGLMTLYEEGRFQLDDPCSRYIPELKDLRVFETGTADNYTTREPSREMTIRDVLSHMSGLSSRGVGVAGELYDREGYPSNERYGPTLHDGMKLLGSLPLQVDPGSQWIYGVSTDVVAYLCEVISGQSFDQFIHDRVIGPLNMIDTAYEVSDEKLERFTANYEYAPDQRPTYRLTDTPTTSPYRHVTYFAGTSGLVSTASDYLRFCKMLANGGTLDGVRILGPRTLSYMTSNHLPGGRDLASLNRDGRSETATDGVGFGLGFAVLLDPVASQTLGTPGEFYWGGAASTAFFVSPAEDLIMLFLTQLRPSSTYPIRRELRVAIHQALLN
jgi:CubicO group peptidase (beta-lactamase class C family)